MARTTPQDRINAIIAAGLTTRVAVEIATGVRAAAAGKGVTQADRQTVGEDGEFASLLRSYERAISCVNARRLRRRITVAD